MRLARLMVVGWLLALEACGARAGAQSASSSGGTSGGSTIAEGPQTPEQLDARYREVARHLVRNAVWDSPLRALNAEGLAALRAYSQSRGNPETYLTLEVTSADWSVMRHNVSGVVTGRSVGAVAIARFPDGRCMIYGTSLRQQYVGDDFSPTLTTSGTGGGALIRCETVEAIAAARSDVAN